MFYSMFITVSDNINAYFLCTADDYYGGGRGGGGYGQLH